MRVIIVGAGKIAYALMKQVFHGDSIGKIQEDS